MAIVDGVENEFPVDTVNSSGDTVQLKLTVEDTLAGGITTEQSEDNNLFVHKYGNLSMRFDFDDALLIPGDVTIEIYDPDAYYDKMFDEAPSTWNKRMQIELLINASVVFLGYAYEDDVSYELGSKLFRARFSSTLDELNKQYLDDQLTNAPLDPLGYGSGTNWVLLSTILTDMFQFAEPTYNAVTTHLLNRCTWHPDVVPTWTVGIGALELDTGYIFDPGNSRYNSSTLGDLLREFAFAFGSYAGVWGLDPFFIQLFEAHSGNSQTLTDIELMQKGYAYQTLEYIKIDSVSACGASAVASGNIGKSGIEGKRLIDDIAHYFCFTGGANMRGAGQAPPGVLRVQDLVINPGYYQAQQHWVDQFNWYYRGSGSGFNEDRFQRRDIFRYPRVDADPTKHFTFDSRDYFITEFDIDIEKNSTKIAASIYQ